MSERESCDVSEIGFKSLVTACSELVGGRKSLFPRGITFNGVFLAARDGQL